MLRKAGLLSVLLIVALGTGASAKMIAYYPFEEGQGTATADVTGNGNNGTLSSGVTWVTGVKGTGVHFDTAGERIVIGPIDPSGGTNAMTLAAWINWQGQGNAIAQQGIIGKRLGWDTTGSTIKWFWQTNPAGDLLFRADFSGGGTSFGWGNTLLVPYANEWTHVAVTWANGAAAQYINAAQVSTGNVTFRESANTTPVTIGCVDSTNTETFVGTIDEVRIYDIALAAGEIAQAMTGDTAPASAPQPAAGATDVAREAVFSWTPGEFAASHDVYFGTDFTTVDQASRTDDRGVLVSTGQTATSYDPEGVLDFGQVYYWRIDEVNAPPDSSISKGPVWSFTAEPYTYALTNVTATASSNAPGVNPQNTVNGSGLNASDQHSADLMQMWMSSGAAPNWIRYGFDAPYKLYEMWVWNSNQLVEPYVGFGAKNVTIEYSVDGTNWTTLEGVPEFAQAPGLATYTANTIVDFGGVMAKFVKLTINRNWGGVMPQTGLSEVRFYYAPVQARAPMPADGATDVALGAELSWRPGRGVTSHEVFFGTDSNAVADGTVAGEAVAEPKYVPATMNLGTKYYWKVDEIGEADSYPGNLWSFTTQEYAVVDDFESYTDDEGSRIYQTWIDGFADKSSGSTVGYLEAPFAERKIIHGGNQSMPFEYNNAESPFFSEAYRDFSPTQNWTANGADTFALWVRGAPAAYMEDNGVITMSGGGHDIWDNADDFRFAYKTLTGNGTAIVKVESLVNTNVWAKAGVMIRQSLNADSKFAYAIVSYSSGVSMGWRPLEAGACDSVTVASVAAPRWVKLTRAGDIFTAQYSTDGKTWTDLKSATVSSTTVAMTGPVYVGLCVTSHDAAATTTAVMSGVAVTGTVSGDWQVATIGDDPQPTNSPTSLYVTVQDSAGKTATATNATAAMSAEWTQWKIPISSLTGVNLKSVKKLYLGAGSKANPVKGGAGMLYIDDIGFGHPVQ
jgi:regulation of enolase protein 1 (concanavalin A-like superfamily)